MRGRAKEGEEKKEKEMVKREVKLRKRDLYHRFRIRFRIRKIILQESLKILNQTSTDIFQGFYMGFSHDGSGRIHRATTRCCCCLLEMSSVVMAGGVGEVSGRRVGEVVTRFFCLFVCLLVCFCYFSYKFCFYLDTQNEERL